MSDLVERLRCDCDSDNCTFKLAAARIAQLEGALRAIKRGAVWNADIEVFISAALEAAMTSDLYAKGPHVHLDERT